MSGISIGDALLYLFSAGEFHYQKDDDGVHRLYWLETDGYEPPGDQNEQNEPVRVLKVVKQ